MRATGWCAQALALLGNGAQLHAMREAALHAGGRDGAARIAALLTEVAARAKASR